jgi:hypothetical protein
MKPLHDGLPERNAGRHHEIETRHRLHARQKTRSGRRRSTATPLFAVWQPLYHERGIAVFPVRFVDGQKKPAIKRWSRVGLPGSAELAKKFPDADAFGFCPGQRTGLTILDIDTKDETVLADALTRHGETKVIVRTGSGKFHAYYKHNGEPRLIRPFAGRPIDVLGGGFVVAPPSQGTRQQYEFIAGSLDDLDTLSIMRGAAVSPAFERVSEGQRNKTLFDHCMRQAHHCDDLDALIDVARTRNDEFLPPLPEGEVIKTARSAWSYTESGKNRYGQTGVWFSTEETNTLIAQDHDAFLLLAFLRANNGPNSTFMVANGLEERIHMPRKRLAAARKRLEQSHLDRVRPASRYGGPTLAAARPPAGRQTSSNRSRRNRGYVDACLVSRCFSRC